MLIHLSCPYRGTCLATATAMVCQVPVEKVFELAGHDGTAKLWPHLPEPLCRRGHVVSEMVMVAQKLGYHLMPVIPSWPAVPKDGEMPFDVKLPDSWIKMMFDLYSGIVIGFTPLGQYHAVAWDHQQRLILDPNGGRFGMNHLKLESFWARES